MREIKFRGKRISDGDWFHGNLITEVDDDHKVTNAYIHVRLSKVDFTEDSIMSRMSLHKVDPETVGQYTGLKDKNGKEIYEDDIATWFINDITRTAPVYYDEDQASFWMGNDVNGQGGLVLNDWLRGEYEVIGNIHDNADLLST